MANIISNKLPWQSQHRQTFELKLWLLYKICLKASFSPFFHRIIQAAEILLVPYLWIFTIVYIYQRIPCQIHCTQEEEVTFRKLLNVNSEQETPTDSALHSDCLHS